MKTVCAWCGKILSGDGKEPISHGMCKDCAAKMLKQMEGE